ncbi:hypothetical protein JL09_g6052, partial [Pichia kudriavzevii]
SQMFEEYIDIG